MFYWLRILTSSCSLLSKLQLDIKLCSLSLLTSNKQTSLLIEFFVNFFTTKSENIQYSKHRNLNTRQIKAWRWTFRLSGSDLSSSLWADNVTCQIQTVAVKWFAAFVMQPKMFAFGAEMKKKLVLKFLTSSSHFSQRRSTKQIEWLWREFG